MAIKLVHVTRHHLDEPDQTRVQVICDYCGEAIKDAGDGMYVWDTKDTDGRLVPEYVEGKPWDFYTIHKGPCDQTFCKEQEWNGFEMSMELTVLPVFLAANLGLIKDEDWKRAKENAAFTSQ